MMSEAIEATAAPLRKALFTGGAAELSERINRSEDAARDLLAEATGISDAPLLAKLARIGVRAETLAAFTLAPLVEVAWVDGDMDAKERDAILAGAASTGIEEASLSYQLLEIWTQEQPAPELFTLWVDFTKALGAQLSADERTVFQDKIVGRARAVAEAAGGILGLGNKVSRVEADALERIDSAF